MFEETSTTFTLKFINHFKKKKNKVGMHLYAFIIFPYYA